MTERTSHVPLDLPPALAELLGKVLAWNNSRQYLEYSQPPEEQWEELDTGAYTLLSNIAHVLEERYPQVAGIDWRDTPLL